MTTDTWTAVTPRSGGLTHITSLTDAHRTQCGKICSGWKVSTGAVSCDGCKRAVCLPVKRVKRGKK